MKANKKSLVNLTEKETKQLFKFSSPITLKKKDTLFHQGEVSTSLYFVISGVLSATLEKPNHKLVQIGIIKSGQMVGEMGLLTGEPRALTIEALTDCELVQLTADGLEKFMQESPGVMREFVATAIKRSQQAIKLMSEQTPLRYIALLSANNNVNMDAFLQELRNYSNIKYLSADDFKDGQVNYTEALGIIDERLICADTIFYHLPRSDAQWVNACLHRATHIIVLAEANKKVEFSAFFADKFQDKLFASKKKELVLLHRQGNPIRGTSDWLAEIPFSLHHHIHWQTTADYQRLGRFMKGTATGLVLSGGGIRVGSQVGALQYLREKQVTIDAVGGTSGGAMVAAAYLTTSSHEEFVALMKRFMAVGKDCFRLRSLVFPIVSLYGMKRVEESIKQFFENISIEDLPKYYYAISSNMTRQKEQVYREGSLNEAFRATTSLPGLAPPLLKDGELLCDGGVLNNLPTDHMRELLGDQGRIIAVDTAGKIADTRRYNFPAYYGLIDTLFARSKWLNHGYVWPHFGENLLRALMMGATTKHQKNLTLVDALIRPEIDEFSMLDFKPETQAKLVALGYDAAVKSLGDFL